MTGHGFFHWNELMTRDLEGAKKFYEDTIGWTFSGMDMPEGFTYWVAMDGERPIGGMFDISGSEFEGTPANWFAYIAVDDIDARVEKAKAAGATIIREARDVEGVGRIAMLQQPDGAMIGWMTPAENS